MRDACAGNRSRRACSVTRGAGGRDVSAQGQVARGDRRSGRGRLWRSARSQGLTGQLSPDDVRTRVERAFGGIRTDLEELVRIPSVSADESAAGQVRKSAEATRSWLKRSGLQDVELLEVDGAHPAVFGTTPGPAGAPTVLLYAHHDVQPPGPRELWESSPFEPTERGGRLFGRGTADDKAGIAVHAAAIKAWAGRPPLDVAIFVEGEEETGSTHLPGFLSRYKELLQADAIVIADCSNWAIGRPTLITSLRGIVDCAVEVRTLDHAVHSGKYGGPVPDALTALCRLISTLHDAAGTVAVDGLHTGPPHAVPMEAGRLRQVVGLRPQVQLLGEGALTQQMWSSPAVAVLGIDAPPVAG